MCPRAEGYYPGASPAGIQPAILAIYHMPVGTDLRLEEAADGSLHFYDSRTGAEVKTRR